MPTLKQIGFTSALVLTLLSTAIAQERTSVPVQRSALTITAAASGERVRITAPSAVVQMRVEVYSATGQKLLDNEVRGGNVFDWHLQDGQAQRLAAGTYVCVVTAKSISGRLTQKMGAVRVEENTVTVQPADSQQLSARQAETIGPVEDDSSWTILGEKENQTSVAIAHDGTDGQMIRGRGALSFRIGDFFSGTDKEQMRLTEDGDLGIGTAKPKAKLDVAGMIRARAGFLFANGSTLNVNDKGALTLTNSDGNVVPNVAGSGTQNRIAKWTDNAGTLGDSSLTDTGGNVGLGVTSPGDLLDIAGATNAEGRTGIRVRTTVSTGNSTLYFDNDRGNFAAYGGLLTGGSTNPFTFFGVTRADKTFLLADGPSSLGLGIGTLVSKPVIFGTANTERMRIESSGNVGIGVTIPIAKLDVAGAVNTSTQYNIGANRVLGVTGGTIVGFNSNSNTFAGVGAGTATTPSAGGSSGNSNSFFGLNAGHSNVTGTGNAFFGVNAGSDNTSSFNSFFGAEAGVNNMAGNANSFFGESAGGDNTTGSHNSYFGQDAAFGTGAGTGNENSFFGAAAGHDISTGGDNSFFGFEAGQNITTGANNTFIGKSSGQSNIVENNNTLIGYFADGAAGITNATAIGAQANVTQSNSLVLGSINGINGATADTRVGIGTTAPVRHLHVFGAGDQQIAIESSDTNGRQWTLQSSKGTSDGRFEIIDRTANASRLAILSTGEVGIGTTAPTHKLEVNGAVAGVGPYQDISDVRFKKNIYPLSGALNKVLRLRGVSFDWRSDEFPGLNFSKGRQVGFIAQEMAAVLPEAVSQDNNGYYRMAYSEVTPLLVEAIKEQQQQLQQKRARIEALETRLAALEIVVKNISVRQRPRRR